MPQAHFIDSQSGLAEPRIAVRYCRECWRDDAHLAVPVPALLKGFLAVATLGLGLLFRPLRCTCCGTWRWF